MNDETKSLELNTGAAPDDGVRAANKIRDAHGNPRKYQRVLEGELYTCKTCNRGAPLAVLYESKMQPGATCECTNCGAQVTLPYVPPATP